LRECEYDRSDEAGFALPVACREENAVCLGVHRGDADLFLGYIDIVTFAPERLGVSIGGFMTVGILVSLLVIRRRLRAHWPLRAPRQYYDALTRQIIEKVEHRHAMSLKEGEPAPKGSRKISCRGAGKARAFRNFVPGKQSPSLSHLQERCPGHREGVAPEACTERKTCLTTSAILVGSGERARDP